MVREKRNYQSLTSRLARFIWGSLLASMRRNKGRTKVRAKMRKLNGPMATAMRRSTKAQEMFALRYGRRLIHWSLNLLALAIMITVSYEILTELTDRGWLTLNREEVQTQRPSP